MSSIRTNRARCALYKKVLDLLVDESVSGVLSDWRASEASETLSGLFNRESHIYIYILEKWFPLWGERAHSLKLFCVYDKRFEILKTK